MTRAVRQSFGGLSHIFFAGALALGASGCLAGGPPAEDARAAEPGEVRRARGLLCADVGERVCRRACPERGRSAEQVDCLLRLRFGGDRLALTHARALYRERGTLLGIDMRRSIEGYRGVRVDLFPALPLGDDRHHLEWLNESLGGFQDFIDSVAARAARPVSFEPRPKGFVFFRTAVPSYPSAYAIDEMIGYNLDGPLHTEHREMHVTLFHELFHLNDARHGMWSERVLQPIFDRIVKRCASDHDCLRPFAPFDTVLAEGTFYAFDERTRDVREYGGELAVRYFIEHEGQLRGEASTAAPFKCLAVENGVAWQLLVDEFFGGVDLTPPCASSTT